MKRYAVWGSDRVYRWLWMAALHDAILAFKKRMRGVPYYQTVSEESDCYEGEQCE